MCVEDGHKKKRKKEKKENRDEGKRVEYSGEHKKIKEWEEVKD